MCIRDRFQGADLVHDFFVKFNVFAAEKQPYNIGVGRPYGEQEGWGGVYTSDAADDDAVV